MKGNRFLGHIFVLHFFCGYLALLLFTVIVFFINKYVFLFCLLLVVYGIIRSFDGSEFRVRTTKKKSFLAKLAGESLMEYFPMKLHVDEDIRDRIVEHSKERKIIVGNHPHGVMSAAPHVYNCGIELERIGLKNIQFKRLTANALFKIPFGRHMLVNYFDAVDASRSVAEKVMKTKDWHLYITVGGEREQIMGQKDKNIIYAKRRKGFIRIAMKYGASIVPTYSFGETELFNQNWFTGIFYSLRLWVVKNFGVALIIPFGLWWFPFLPKNLPLNIVMGEPILVEKVEKEEDLRNEELIQGYLSKYMNGLEKVFEENKNKFGYRKRKLKFV